MTRLITVAYTNVLLVAFSSVVPAETLLYTLNVTGTGNLLGVAPETGATTAVNPAVSLGPGSWNALTSITSQPDLAIAINNPRPATLDSPQFSRLARIDLIAGTAVMLPVFDTAKLGRDQLFSSGVAISPLVPDTVWVTGSNRDFPPKTFIWSADANTGNVLTPAIEIPGTSRIEALTFRPDGETLIGSNQHGSLVTIDPDTGQTAPFGEPGLSVNITGLAYHPGDGRLFAIDGSTRDHLVLLDPQDGHFLSDLGSLGIKGPEGLTFVDIGNSQSLDCDRDGRVDVVDLDCINATRLRDKLLAELGLIAGDLDGRNGVGFPDFLRLSSNFGMKSGKYSDGDIDGNGTVEFADFLILSANFGLLAPPVVGIPEPDGLCPVVIGFGWILSIKRRHKPRYLYIAARSGSPQGACTHISRKTWCQFEGLPGVVRPKILATLAP